MCVPPIFIVFHALFTSDTTEIIGGLLGALSGPVAYYIFKKKYGGLKENPKVEA